MNLTRTQWSRRVTNVIERDGGFCLLALWRCTGEAQVADHRANRGHGGSNILDDPANLAAACSRCNGDKADGDAITLIDLEERGLWVRKAATNETTLSRVKLTPVTYLDGEQFYLLSETERIHVDDLMREAR